MMLEILSFILLVLVLVAVVGVVFWAGATIVTGWLGEKLFDLLVPGRKTGLGPEGVVGEAGTVVRVSEEAAVGRGTVRVGGELWSARWAPEAGLAVGQSVRVVAVEGLHLVVEPGGAATGTVTATG